MAHFFERRTTKTIVVTTLAALMLFVSACNGGSQTQRQAEQSKTSLDRVLVHARDIGVPMAMLQPIMQQEAQMSATSSPFTDSSATQYYSNLTQRYQMLVVQVRGLEVQTTQQLDYQATLDLQTFESILAQRQGQGFSEVTTFATQLAGDQNLLTKAQYPKDYVAISASAKRSTQALRLMGPVYGDLVSLQQTIKQLQASHLDVTALLQQEQYDMQLFKSANNPDDFLQLSNQLQSQLQETVTYSTQVIVYVGAAKLNNLSTQIAQLSQYGQDATSFKMRLDIDRNALSNAKTIGDFLTVSAQIDTDMTATRMAVLQSEANYLLPQFHQEVTNWGNAHLYHNAYDGTTYTQDYEYDQAEGFGADADAAVQTAQTLDDYQAAIDLINNDMLALKAMEADYSDTTPWNQVHATDMGLMQHYHVTTGQVIVVSLIEQALRFYQDGKLVKAFLVTTGQFAKPTPPGFWQIFLRESPTKFKSSEPKGSAFWYPDTNIDYAMEYHDGGYFFHDSRWRVNYGRGTNYPHYDTGGNEAFAGTGSHGCVNMQVQDVGWLYDTTGYGTPVIVY